MLRILNRETQRDTVVEMINAAQLRLAGIGEADLIVGVQMQRVVNLREEWRDADAVGGQQRPALPSEQLPLAARNIGEINAQAEGIGVGADVGVGRQIAVEIGLAIAEDLGISKDLIGTNADT